MVLLCITVVNDTRFVAHPLKYDSFLCAPKTTNFFPVVYIKNTTRGRSVFLESSRAAIAETKRKFEMQGIRPKFFTSLVRMCRMNHTFVIYCESQKLDHFSFEHNFGKYCPILIILSRLQTDINCDQVYPKIYHFTPNLLVHYLVK